MGARRLFAPLPYVRIGPGTALDGKPKFDVSQFDQGYFDRLRARVIEAGNRGMYVSVMLFNGWSVSYPKGMYQSANPWDGHPFNVGNNINGIDGDVNDDNSGSETDTLVNPAITTVQEAYVKKVIDTLNDLDNVLYEISNESDGGSEQWQYHMIEVIKAYEATKPQQHPVGITVAWPGGSNQALFASDADLISPNGGLDNPPAADGSKVIINDTDHLCGICGDRVWVWKSFTRGLNPIFMDQYDDSYKLEGGGYDPNNANDVSLRHNLGYTRGYAERMQLLALKPRSDLSSTGYALANPAASGAEYLVYAPNGGTFTVDLRGTTGAVNVEWFNPRNGSTVVGVAVNGGASRSFTTPFAGDAVLYLFQTALPTATPALTLATTGTGVATAVGISTPTATPAATATPVATATGIPNQTATNTPMLTATRTPRVTATRTPTSIETTLPSLSFPSTAVLDNFERADGPPGSYWSGSTAGYSIAAGRLDVGASEDIYWNATTFGPDQEAFVTFTTIDPNGTELGLILKGQS